MIRATFIVFLSLILSLQNFAQDYTVSSKRAIKQFEKAQSAIAMRSYPEAIDILTKTLKKNPAFLEAWILLGETFQMDRNPQAAIQAFSEGVKQDSSFYPQSLYSLGKLYLAKGDYPQAEKVARTFLNMRTKKEAHYTQAELIYKKAIFAQEQLLNPVPYDPKKLEGLVNDNNSEFINAVTANDSTIFYTYRTIKEKDSKGNPTSYTEYIRNASLNPQDGKWYPQENLKDIFGRPTITGAMTISPKGNEIFFTGCGIQPTMGSCDIYYTRKETDSWSYPINVGPRINSGSWDSQPSLSPDGQTIYFASRRKGGYGMVDLWMSEKDSLGNWQQAVNLGPEINTAGNEFAPFIHADNQTLYFSSDGHIGMGGMDLFVSRKQEDGTFGQVRNLGYPINTHYDEITLVVSANGEKAYFSSDKFDSLSVVNIYSFDLYKEIQPIRSTYLQALVRDINTHQPLNAEASIYSLSEQKLLGQYTTNLSQGRFLAILPEMGDYAIHVESEGYLFYSENIQVDSVSSATKPIQYIIDLTPISKGQSFILNNIYFETDQFALEAKSKFELNQLVLFLKKNPKVKVQIQGHTDDVGNANYNLKLSARRAASVADYLKQNGINAERTETKAYGNTKPIAKGDSNAARAKNRRTEIEIL